MARRDCDQCGTTYERPPSLLGRFCSRACKSASMRLERTTVRRMRKAPDHPLSPPGGYVSVARIVLYDGIGPGPHPCHWCGKLVDWAVGQRGNLSDVLVADHLNSDELDDSPENLVPSCGSCNGNRGNAVPDEAQYVVRPNGTRLRVGQQRACKTCGDTFTTTESRRSYCERHKHAASR